MCLDGEEVLVGSSAEQLKRYDPAAFRSEFKPDLGDRELIPLGGKAFLPQELVAEVLAAIAGEAAELAGAPVTHAVLTVPASYGAGDPCRDLMIEAGERVGFAEVELLPEPVAAALPRCAASRSRPATWSWSTTSAAAHSTPRSSRSPAMGGTECWDTPPRPPAAAATWTRRCAGACSGWAATGCTACSPATGRRRATSRPSWQIWCGV